MSIEGRKLGPATTGGNSEDIMLSEMSQAENGRHYLSLLT